MRPELRYGIVNSLVLTVVLSVLVGGATLQERRSQRRQQEARADGRVAAATGILTAEIEQLASLARALAWSTTIDGFAAAQNDRSAERDLAAQLLHHQHLDQARLLDRAGQELIRVDRVDGEVTPIPSEALQHKRDRYYVQESQQLRPGEVYLSRFDLNVERGAVVDPPHPVLRVVTPTRQGDGLVVLNADASALLAQLDTVEVRHGDEAPGWASGDGQARPDDLRTWKQTALLGRTLVLFSVEPTPALVIPWWIAGVALPAWLLLMGMAWMAAWLQANRARSTRTMRQLNERLLAAQEDERRSVARWLHDELGQDLTAATLHIDRSRGLRDPERQRKALDSARHSTQAVLEKVHQLARELRTPVLDDLGLEAALDELVRSTERPCALTIDLSEPVPQPVAVQAYRIVQEAVRNAVRHSGCDQITVQVAVREHALAIRVEDDGSGFERGPTPGLGLMGLQERADLVGGAVTVTSALGSGTVVTAELPLEAT